MKGLNKTTVNILVHNQGCEFFEKREKTIQVLLA